MADGGYSLSDLYSNTPTPAAPSPAGGSSGGGYSINDLYGGGSPAGAAPSPAAPARPAAAPVHHGGGGILGAIQRFVKPVTDVLAPQMAPAKGGGWLGSVERGVQGAANFVNPVHVATHLAPEIAGAALTDVGHLGLMASQAAGGPGKVTYTPTSPNESPLARLGQLLPFTGGMLNQAQRTGAHAAGVGQAVAGVGQGPKVLFGRGFQHETARDYAADPFGSAVGDVGTAAILGGPLGKALGAAGSALGAEGEAGGLAARLGGGLEAAGRGVGATSEAANRVMQAPFKPFQAGADLLGGVGRGAAGAEGPIAGAAGRAGLTLGAKLADRNIPGGGRTVGEFAAGRAALGEARGITSQGADQLAVRRGTNVMHERAQLAAAGGDPEIAQAAILRAAGRQQGAEVAIAAREHGVALPADMPTDRVAALTAGHGSPLEEQRVQATMAALAPQAAARTGEEFAGVGRTTGPLNPEQAGMTPLTRNVAEQVAPFEKVEQRTGQAAGVLRDRAELLRLRAAQEVPVARGNTGAGAQESAAVVRENAAQAAVRARNAGSAGLQGVTGRALQDLYAPADKATVAAKLEAEQAAARESNAQLGAEVKAQNQPHIVQQNAATQARRLLHALPEQETAATGTLAEAAPRTAAALEQARKAGADVRPLTQPAEEAHLLRHWEAEAKPADPAVAARQAADYAKQTRASVKAAVAQDYQAADDALSTALGSAGKLGPMENTPEWEMLRQAPESLLARARSAGESSQFGGTGLAPDVWAQSVGQSLGLGSAASVEDVVTRLNQMYDQVRELGTAKQSTAKLLAYLDRTNPPEAAAFHEALLRGDTATAGQALIAGGHYTPPSSSSTFGMSEAPPIPESLAVNRALAETPQRPGVPEGLSKVHEDLAARGREASAQVQANIDAAKARFQPTLSPGEIKAEAASRAEQTRLSLAPKEPQIVNAAEANAYRRVGDALNTDSEAAAGRPGYDRLTVHEQGIYRQQVGEDYLTAKTNRLLEARDATFDRIAGRAKSAGQLEGARTERAAVADRAARLAERQHSTAETKLAAERKAAVANPANAPARARPALLANRAQVDAINRVAQAAEAVHPGAGLEVRALTEGLPTVLSQLREQGVDPTHFTGPGGTAAERGMASKVRERFPQPRKLASEHVKETGVLPASTAEIHATEDARARGVVANETAKLLVKKLAPSAADRGIDVTNGVPRDLVPFDPKTPFKAAAAVTNDTPLMPKPVFDAFRTHLGPPETKGTFVSMWDSVIRGGKDLGVGLSPAYWAAVIGADSLKNMAFGDAGGIAWARAIPQALDLIREHPENPLVASLVKRNLSTEQGEITASHLVGKGDAAVEVPGPDPGNLLHRLAAPGWRYTGKIQDVQRVAQAIAARDKGLSDEAAVAEARRVNGRFDNLTPTEQNVRRVIPGYAYYKHIAGLVLKLPVTSPARMAYLGWLYQAMGKPNGPVPSFLNPAGVIGGAPSTAPLVRFPAAMLGLHLTTNLKTLGGETSPTAAAHGPAAVILHGAQGIPEAGYLAAQQFPLTRGLLAAAQPNVRRYQTGEPTKGATPYPGGRLSGVLYGAGLSTPTPAKATTKVPTLSRTSSRGGGSRRGGGRGGTGR